MAPITITAPPTRGAVVPKPTKLSARRPTLVRKLDDTEFETGREAIPSSPSKKTKVTFDDEVEVRVMDDWEKAPAIVREEVRRALERHALGDDSAYERVTEVYNRSLSGEDGASTTTLRNYTAALLSSVSALDRSCSSLVSTVLQSEWATGSEEYVALYLRFLGNLVSAQGTYLGNVIRMLAGYLIYTPLSDSPSLQQPLLTRSHIHSRVHGALRFLLRLIPSASGVLSSILVNLFPHSSDSKRAHISFVHNLLKIVEYAPELQSEILSLIIDRVVKIDVQVQVDLEDLADDIEEGVVQGISDLQSRITEDIDGEDESDSDEDDSDGEELDPDSQRAKEITANVEKMDMILDILFEYFTPLFSETSEQPQQAPLDILYSHFTTIILPAYRSRHTQFLLFHFAQTSPALMDNFVAACIQFAFDKSRPPIMRQSAAAYLASFVARGLHVPSQIVRDVFDYIGDQLNNYRVEYEPTCRGPDRRRYSNYYSLLQALLYIFCFRWRDLEAGPEEQTENDDIPLLDDLPHVWIPGIKETLAQNIFSKLNPLKVCSPAIVSEFAQIAHHLGFIYVFHLLETNKRLRLSQFSGSLARDASYSLPERETALSSRKDESLQQLDEYFPFDPYHLPRSKRWIEGDYRVWKGIPGLHDKDERDERMESDEDEDEEILGDEEGTGTDDDSVTNVD